MKICFAIKWMLFWDHFRYINKGRWFSHGFYLFTHRKVNVWTFIPFHLFILNFWYLREKNPNWYVSKWRLPQRKPSSFGVTIRYGGHELVGRCLGGHEPRLCTPSRWFVVGCGRGPSCFGERFQTANQFIFCLKSRLTSFLLNDYFQFIYLPSIFTYKYYHSFS